MSEASHQFTRTRIAPTPSGYLHLGNAFSFALTAALAQQYNARILLRIDDLDRERTNKAYIQDIFDTLHFLQIPWHEGPRDIQEFEQQYSQVHRMPLYNEALQQLRDANDVFACSCSRTQVLQSNSAGAYTGTCLHRNLPFESNAWRLDTSLEKQLTVKTLNGETIDAKLPAEMQYFVVRKKDGFPAYQLASLVDDGYFKVDLIVRGADLWPSTLAQHYLAHKLNKVDFLNTVFYHHALFTSKEGGKLSKSSGSTSVQYLRKQGKTAEEIYAMVGQMAGIGVIKGWEEIPGWLTAGLL